MISISNKLNELSDIMLNDVLAKLPKDNKSKFIIFLEIVRNIDYWSVHQKRVPKSQSISLPDFEIMLQGWNLVLEHLCVKLNIQGIPICERTDNLQLTANTIIHCFGRSVLLKRVAKMVEAQLVDVNIKESKIEITVNKSATSQFLDILEFSSLEELYKDIDSKQNFNGFNVFSMDLNDIDEINLDLPGAFCINNSYQSIKQLQLPEQDVINKMEDLLFPWDSGYGIGTGYDAVRELDLHYVSKALEICERLRNDFGLHPSVQFTDIRGEYLTLIIAVIVALHLKHIDFVLLACKKHPQISPHFSLTIWTEKSQLIDEIQGLTDFDRNIIETAVNAITLSSTEYNKFSNDSEPVIPLLIDLGNGFVLKPISSLIKNPFFVAASIQNLRTPNLENLLSKPRENWMREHLYAMFKGNRYSTLEGNANLKNEGKIVTDIDAAILDITSGELALFQIKWQDYYTNDVKKLLSKSNNLIKGIESWSEKVENWIEIHGINSLLQALRIKVPKSKPIRKVLLFGLSKSYARTRGFGVELKHRNTALCNWPAFVQARIKIGPTKMVFTEIFKFIQNEYYDEVETTPIPHSIKVRETQVKFNNLWCGY